MYFALQKNYSYFFYKKFTKLIDFQYNYFIIKVNNYILYIKIYESNRSY